MRTKNPAGKLLDPNNSATPELPSHVKSLAGANAARSVPTDPFPPSPDALISTATSLQHSAPATIPPAPSISAVSSRQGLEAQSHKRARDPDVSESDDSLPDTLVLQATVNKGPPKKKKKVSQSRGE